MIVLSPASVRGSLIHVTAPFGGFFDGLE